MALSICRSNFLMQTHKQKHKILFLSKELCLIEVDIQNGVSKTIVRHDYQLNKGCSFSPPIQNRFVYTVGGYSKDVYYYDLKDGRLRRGPPLCFKIWKPTLVLLGSKLFAFSHLVTGSFSDPIAQFLDFADYALKWSSLQTRPEHPYAPLHDYSSYCVAAYATNSNSDDFFVSLGFDLHSIAFCYNYSEQKWSNSSEKALPFYGQGKFVGLFCYAFPRLYHTRDNSEHLIAYNLSIDWNTDAKVSCVNLCKYSLVSNSPYPTASYLHSFFADDQNIFTIVRAKISVAPKTYVDQYSLEVDVVELFPSPPPLPHPSEFESFPSPPPPPYVDFIFPSPSKRESRRGSDIIESSSHARNSRQKVRKPYAPEPCRSEGNSQVLNHKSISLPHQLEEIIGEFYQ